MKKTLLVLSMLTFAGSWCFAAGQPATSGAQAAANPAVVKTFAGNVESVTLGDPAKNTRSTITVMDSAGKKISFIVGAGADISGKDGKATTLDKVVKGDKVVVHYTTTKKGARKAKSVKITG